MFVRLTRSELGKPRALPAAIAMERRVLRASLLQPGRVLVECLPTGWLLMPSGTDLAAVHHATMDESVQDWVGRGWTSVENEGSGQIRTRVPVGVYSLAAPAGETWSISVVAAK